MLDPTPAPTTRRTKRPPRTSYLMARVTPAELEAVHDLAALQDISASELVRRAIRSYMPSGGTDV